MSAAYRAAYRADSLRSILVPIEFEQFYRIIPSSRRDTPLGTGITSSRFSSQKGNYSVLYAAATVECSVYEAIVRGRLDHQSVRKLARADVEDRHIVELMSINTLQLIDLRGAGPRTIGVPTDAVGGSTHHEGQVLSESVHMSVPDADGFLYPSRHTTHLCVAVFDRASSKLSPVAVEPLMRHQGFHDALEHYRIMLYAEHA